ncbi:unnamed protein product [Caenorhabditis auriculariae]|uniref:Bifunctional polynucleotide phosphatase/kinase n=1 Tax=Caenorhabditis auriculariae TaxID=2777116 RepID=A0A8S1HDE0_9PELO|nr:unnamed protein product [Caenorhabditis auriculariae]
MKRTAEPEKTATDQLVDGSFDYVPSEKMKKNIGTWEYYGSKMLVFTHEKTKGRSKLACFDFDGTLIIRTPTDPETPEVQDENATSLDVTPDVYENWELRYKNMPSRLQQLYEDGFKIVVFSNQKGVEEGTIGVLPYQMKVEKVAEQIGVPIQVFVAMSHSAYRKPCTGLWDALEERNDGVSIDKEASFYVGDAAGRHPTEIHPKRDKSSADRFFALNVGLRFQTPEQFFEGLEVEEPWGPPSFDPRKLLASRLPELDPVDTKLPSEGQEVIVMVGFPGSGKSTFSKKIADEYGYFEVSRDKIGGPDKCVAVARKALEEGKSVVIDNTGPDLKSRKHYIDVAKEMGVGCRCFEMNCDFGRAQHSVRYRLLTSEDAPDVGVAVLQDHQDRYKKPHLDEGFDSIVTVNLVPDFENDSLKELYSKFLADV